MILGQAESPASWRAELKSQSGGRCCTNLSIGHGPFRGFRSAQKRARRAALFRGGIGLFGK